ncbi:MAG: hypothetical protein JWO71_4631 [Candidatus Acidoferrum typicum]|nr:hypothetical protein [Candidatus Acidoferrum typicum]
MTPFEDKAPLVIFIGIVLVLISAVAVAYVQSSRTKRASVRRRASWIAASASGVVAFFATVAFAIPVLEDLHNPHVSFRQALLGTVIIWAACLLVWGIAVKCTISALRKDSAP